jgi:ribosomal protein L37AE/L43A
MSPYRTVNIKRLTPGDTLGEPVLSEGLTKLLGSGCAVSEQLIVRLAERGVTEVVVRIPAERIEKPQRRTALPPSNVRRESVNDSSHVVEHLCNCGSVIAIQAPAADLSVAIWICKTCGAAYFGGANTAKTRGVELLAGIDGSALAGEDQTKPIAESTPAKTDVAASSSATDTLTGMDRREQTRYSIGVPVVAVPLRANFSIAGPAVRMTTRDISKSGVALAYARFSDAPYYVIDFTAAGIELLQVLLKVLRVRNTGPTYEVAGNFINRLHCADWHNKCS